MNYKSIFAGLLACMMILGCGDKKDTNIPAPSQAISKQEHTATPTKITDNIPEKLAKNMELIKPKSMSLSDGVLRIVLDKPIVTQEVYKSVLSYGACYSLWKDEKNGWGKSKIQRIEVMNRSEGSGFALIDARKSCEKLGNLPEEKAAEYRNKHTWVCVASSPCRERRQGEKIAGDE